MYRDYQKYREYQRTYYRRHIDLMRRRARVRARARKDREGYERRYIGFAMTHWRYLPAYTREQIQAADLKEDIIQALRLLGLEVLKKAYDLEDPQDARQAWLYVGRRLYGILKDYGFYRPKGSRGYVPRLGQLYAAKEARYD